MDFSTGVPDSIQFQTKPEIALDQLRRTRERGVPQRVVLADAGYGADTGFHGEVTKLEMSYVVGMQSTTTAWKPGEGPKRRSAAAARKGNTGRPRQLLQRDAQSQPEGFGERAGRVCEGVHTGRYRQLPVRRVYVPKSDGGQRRRDRS